MRRFVKLGPAGPLRTHLTFHLHDWIGLLGLIILDACLNIIHPFKRFVGEFFINDVRFPLKSNTIPVATVPVIAVGIPLVFFIAYYIYKRDIRDLHQAVLGLLYAVLITAVITDAVKDGVGRPRPNFFWRCFPNGIGVYDNTTRAAICHGDRAVVKEGYKSFPSGHTSWSFAGLGYLSMYFAGKLAIFDRRGRVGKLIIVTTPLLLATLVGVSRVDDYWHHWQDVFAGAILGLVVAYICYRQHFPSLYDDLCMEPYPCIAVRVADWPPEANGTPTRDLEVGRSVQDSSF